ncbi:hypothetical protein D1BOALGB6SA_4493 [Olavius sp. associated proteobacterium Delta 1]|nr:hypothetical protein D1BOALGB6SA_4493 [Olavius sp. associated proteobacterium Delta 1]
MDTTFCGIIFFKLPTANVLKKGAPLKSRNKNAGKPPTPAFSYCILQKNEGRFVG